MTHDERDEQRSWTTPAAATIALLVGAGAFAVAAVFAADLVGAAFFALAGLLLLVTGATSAITRPRLALVDPAPAGEPDRQPDGGVRIALRTLAGRHVYRPSDLTQVRVTTLKRLGRSTGHLEIETSDDRFYVLGRWDLGTDPRDVAAALAAHGVSVRGD